MVLPAEVVQPRWVRAFQAPSPPGGDTRSGEEEVGLSLCHCVSTCMLYNLPTRLGQICLLGGWQAAPHLPPYIRLLSGTLVLYFSLPHSPSPISRKVATTNVEDSSAPRLQAPEFVRSLSPEDREILEKKLKRKIDLRLLPAIIIMYIMNYIDRCVYTSPFSSGLFQRT